MAYKRGKKQCSSQKSGGNGSLLKLLWGDLFFSLFKDQDFTTRTAVPLPFPCIRLLLSGRRAGGSGKRPLLRRAATIIWSQQEQTKNERCVSRHKAGDLCTNTQGDNRLTATLSGPRQTLGRRLGVRCKAQRTGNRGPQVPASTVSSPAWGPQTCQ